METVIVILLQCFPSKETIAQNVNRQTADFLTLFYYTSFVCTTIKRSIIERVGLWPMEKKRWWCFPHIKDTKGDFNRLEKNPSWPDLCEEPLMRKWNLKAPTSLEKMRSLIFLCKLWPPKFQGRKEEYPTCLVLHQIDGRIKWLF